MQWIVLFIVLVLAVLYWPVTLGVTGAVVIGVLIARHRREVIARAIAALPATPNRVAGPVRWKDGVLELTPAGVVVTRVALQGGRTVSTAAVIPRDRIMSTVTASTKDRGVVLTFIAKGGNHAYGHIRGDAVPLLDALGVPVTENGTRWTKTPAVREVVPARATKCSTCGAPLAVGSTACAYCHHPLGSAS